MANRVAFGLLLEHLRPLKICGFMLHLATGSAPWNDY
jgi:hypothetical protein